MRPRLCRNRRNPKPEAPPGPPAALPLLLRPLQRAPELGEAHGAVPGVGVPHLKAHGTPTKNTSRPIRVGKGLCYYGVFLGLAFSRKKRTPKPPKPQVTLLPYRRNPWKCTPVARRLSSWKGGLCTSMLVGGREMGGLYCLGISRNPETQKSQVNTCCPLNQAKPYLVVWIGGWETLKATGAKPWHALLSGTQETVGISFWALC